MRIVLMRHGAAVGHPEADRDEDRWLLPEGRLAVRAVAKLLRDEGVSIDRVLTSPLVRAVQTAELLGEAFDCDQIVTHAAMAPDRGDVDHALRPLRALGGDETIALVGHESKIRALSQRLGGTMAASGFRTSEAHLFEATAEGYRLICSVDRKGGVVPG